mgnify:CR=1 FL=1
MNAATRAKWLRFVVLILGGGTIYKLANIKDAFYVPMQQDMGLTHTEIGTMLSINAIVATVLFVVGGMLADRFETRKLIPVGLIGAGLLGLYMATFPGYNQMLIIYALLAVCADCIYWPALLKAIRNLGDDDEQGRMFGFLEGGRGVVDTVVAFSALGVFVAMGSGAQGLKSAIMFYAIIDIVAGLVTWFLLSGGTSKKAEPAPAGSSGILEAMRVPAIWLVSLNVFMVYIVYCGLTYFIPYLKDMYGLPVALVGAYGIINQYGLKMVGGLLSDKLFHSPTKYLRIGYLITAVVLIAFTWMPYQTLRHLGRHHHLPGHQCLRLQHARRLLRPHG